MWQRAGRSAGAKGDQGQAMRLVAKAMRRQQLEQERSEKRFRAVERERRAVRTRIKELTQRKERLTRALTKAVTGEPVPGSLTHEDKDEEKEKERKRKVKEK